MIGVTGMEKTEADIPIFSKAVKKFESCPNAVSFYGQMACSIFRYTFDTSFDIMHHCASCKFNTKSPTTYRDDARIR